MNGTESFVGRLPFEMVIPSWRSAHQEKTRPFIETREGRYCHRLLSREMKELWQKRILAEVVVSDNEIQLRLDERANPYKDGSRQYRGVALRPNSNSGVDVLYTYLGADNNEPKTDWVIYRSGVPMRNGISEALRAAGMAINLSGDARETTLTEHVGMAMKFAWHYPHNFHDGPINP